MHAKMTNQSVSESPQISKQEKSPPAVSVQGLSKTYGSGEGAITALSDVGFDIEQGAVVGILGPNGAGKTTLIKSLLNLVIPTTGTIKLFGDDIDNQDANAYRRVGAMFEGARNIYWRLSVRQNLNFFTRLEGKNPADRVNRFDSLLNNLGLKSKENQAVRNLSRGQKQKVSIATILSADNDLIFLDEPTLGLDVESSQELQAELKRLVNDGETTVILSSHDMDVIENLCDRAIILQNGEIIADDTIDSFYSIFETDLYEITVKSRIDDEIRQELESQYNLHSVKAEEDARIHYRFAVSDADRIPALTDLFVGNESELAKVSLVERNFEDIFLSVTNSEDRSNQPKSEMLASSQMEAQGDDRA